MLQRSKKLVIATVFAVFLLMVSLFLIPISQCENDLSSSFKLDLFIQKPTDDGQGLNETTVFAPLEKVELTANVTYNRHSLDGFPVSFQVDGPGNSSGSVHLFRSTFTNQSGQATISFVIPALDSDKQITGIWTAYAFGEMSEATFFDTLTFEVISKQVRSSFSFRDTFAVLLVVIVTLIIALLLLILSKRKRNQEIFA